MCHGISDKLAYLCVCIFTLSGDSVSRSYYLQLDAKRNKPWTNCGLVWELLSSQSTEWIWSLDGCLSLDLPKTKNPTILSTTKYGRLTNQILWSSGQSSLLLNWDKLYFLWGKNSIYICYVEESRPPLWSSGQSYCLLNGDILCFLRGTNWIYICYVEKSRPPLWSSGQSSRLLNGDELCILWGTNLIYICYVEESRPTLWSSGQSSWLLSGDE
jgi:hypothetical protein